MFPDYFMEQANGIVINKKQFCTLLGKDIKTDIVKKRGNYTVYDSFNDVTDVSLFGRIIRSIVNLGLKMMFRGKSKQDPAFRMVKMGVEEGNLEGLIATSGGIATPKLIEMLVYNANKEYGKAFLRMLQKQ